MTIPVELVVEGKTTVLEVTQEGIPEANLVPSPVGKPNGYQLAILGNKLVYVPPPAGSGDMRIDVYDPNLVADDAFALENMQGELDCGTF